MDFFSFSVSVFFFVCCWYRHLPSFSRDQKSILDHPFNIKSGRYLYTQQTQFAETVFRSFMDVSMTDNNWFLSFIFNATATGRVMSCHGGFVSCLQIHHCFWNFSSKWEYWSHYGNVAEQIHLRCSTWTKQRLLHVYLMINVSKTKDVTVILRDYDNTCTIIYNNLSDLSIAYNTQIFSGDLW